MKKMIRHTVMVGGCVWLLQTSSAVAQFADDALRFAQFNMNAGTQSAGMGNASIALANDYSSLFANPAGLASLRSHEFSVGLSRLGYDNDVSFFDTKTSSNNSALGLNNVALVYSVPTTRGSLTLAAGFGRIADYTATMSFNGFNPSSSIVKSLSALGDNIPYEVYLANYDTLRRAYVPVVTDSVQQSGTVLEGGGMNSWTIGGAIDIARNISFGISLNFLNGSYSYDRQFIESDPGNIYTLKGNR